MADEVVVENKTKIGVRADMTIDDEPVAVEGLLGGDFFLQLNKPATIGTPISFAYWLRDTYKVQNLDIMLPSKYSDSNAFKAAYKAYKSETNAAKKKEFEKDISDNLTAKGIPEQLHELMISAFLAELTITDLLIDIKAKDVKQNTPEKKKMMFGLSVGFAKPLALLPNIEVNKLSILIMNAPENDFTFPKRVELPRSTPLPIEPACAAGYILFTANPAKSSTVTLGADVWTFVEKNPSGKQVAISDSLDGTLTALAAALNGASAGDTALCDYRANADEKRLEITYKTVGASGNDFTIAADAQSKGTVSEPTLKGGLGEEPKKAQGTAASGNITFSANPEDGGKITLNSVPWEFVTTDPAVGEAKSKIGASVTETIAELAKQLSASTDAKLANCNYTADGSKLVVTYKQPGPAGNDVTLAADAKSKGTVSSAKLTGGV